MYYITQNENGLITGRYILNVHGDNIPSGAVEISEELFNASVQMQRPALVEGSLTELPLDAPTPEQLAQQAKSSVYALLDTTAQKYDYRNFAEVVQFLNSGAWKAEAETLIAWQDVVWTKAYELLKAPIVSVSDFLAQLPQYVPSDKQSVTSITPRQVRLQLTAIGMRQAVEDYVAASTQDVKDWWEFSTLIERDAPLLITTATLLGMSSAQLDQFFVEASKL